MAYYFDQGSSPSIKNGDLLQTWVEAEKSVKIQAVCDKIRELLHLEESTEEVDLEILKVSKYFCLKLRQKWESCQRKRDKFMVANEGWLDLNLQLPVNVLARVSTSPGQPGTSRGRPAKSFEECSQRTKKRRVQELTSQHSTEELNYAAKMSKRLSDSGPQTSDKTLTLQQSLALYLDLNLTKRKYSLLRSVVNSIHPDCFPSYYKLQKYKTDLLPEISAVSETTAQVNLQSLLDTTSKSIVDIFKTNLSSIENISCSFDLVCKWGFDGKNVNIKYTMLMTMLDGSAINTLSGTNAAQNCYICGAKPSQMNLLSVEDRTTNTESYRFGLSSLHSWIRCFECLLHISYRLPFRTWQIRGPENKAAFGERKKKSQEDFRLKMGLLVDIPKPGYGTSNDGNTARRFFSNPELSSEITGIDKELIRRFGIILRTIASGHEINEERFVKLLDETKTMYLSQYSWYYMPSSVHKLLVHSKDIISFFQLPIGVLSEEALEARHKEIRKTRLEHSRKCSRTNSMIDLINHLLISSDPFISNIRSKSTHSSKVDPDIDQYLVKNNPDVSTLPIDIEDFVETSSDED